MVCAPLPAQHRPFPLLSTALGTNPYPYGKHSLFTPTGPGANLATRGSVAAEAAAAYVRATPRSVVRPPHSQPCHPAAHPASPPPNPPQPSSQPAQPWTPSPTLSVALASALTLAPTSAPILVYTPPSPPSPLVPRPHPTSAFPAPNTFSPCSQVGAVGAVGLAPQRSSSTTTASGYPLGLGAASPSAEYATKHLSLTTPAASRTNPLVAFRSPRALDPMLMPDLPDPALYDPEPVATGGGADAADADADAEGSGYGAAADGGAGVAVAGLGMPSICRARTPSAAPLPTPATRQHAEGGGGGGGAPTGGLHHSFGLGALMPSALAAPTPRKGSLTRETMQDLLPQDADQPPPSRKSTSSASMASPMAASASASRAAAAAPPPQPPPLGDDVVSRWSGKATYGPLDELRLLPEEALARVVDFELRRPGYGAVRWLEPVDLRGGLLGQLASVVVFSEREVLVYPSGVAKPPPGEGLNRRCHVSMEGVWPRDRKTGEDLRDARSVQQFRAKLQSHADRLGATMLGYDGELGLWRFQVEHF